MNPDTFQLTFNGTPHEFAVMATEFSKGRQERSEPYFAFYAPRGMDSTALSNMNPVTVVCGQSVPRIQKFSRYPILHETISAAYDRREPRWEYRTAKSFEKWGEITAQKLPNGKSFLRGVAQPEHLAHFEEQWKLLAGEIARQGWLVEVDLNRRELFEIHLNPDDRAKLPSARAQDETAPTLDRQVRRESLHPKKRERKQAVKELWQARYTIEEIAEKVGVSDRTVKRDIAAMRANGEVSE